MKAGALVQSTAGHDKDWLYIVLRGDGDFVYVADGKHHGLDNPKRKRIKHLALLEGEADTTQLLCDAHVRKAIKLLKSEGGCHLG